MPARAIAIIGQSRPDDSPAIPLAEECGRLVAGRGLAVVTGGHGGVMAAASRGARAAGGHVVAVLPGVDPDAGESPADTIVCTGMGEARNLAVVASGDAAIAIGGGWGTLSEIGLARRIGRGVVLLRSWTPAAPPEWDPGEIPPVATSPGEAVEIAVRLAAGGPEA